MGRRLLRYRYALFAAVAGFSGAEMWLANRHRLTEYYNFVYGGRVLAGNMPGYHGSPLHLYAVHPDLQIGPLPLAVYAAIARLPGDVGQALWTALILGLGLISLRAVERLRWHLGRPAASSRTLFDGVAVVGAFCALAWFSHLDDAMALTGIAVASAAIAARRPGWMAALALGVGVSAKPWAIVAAPLLLALPRGQLPRAVGVFAVAAVGPWLPFIVAAPHTIDALTFLPYQISPWSGLRALGFQAGAIAPRQLHAMELVLGVLLGVLAVMRGKWLAVPLLALTTRVLLEPRFWLYYAAAPILAAVIRETTKGRLIPWWVLAAAGVEAGLPYVASPGVVAGGQAALAVLIATSVLVGDQWLRRRQMAMAHRTRELSACEHAIAGSRADDSLGGVARSDG